MTEQIARIQRMEAALDEAQAAAEALEQALARWAAVQPDYTALCAYYGSAEWRRDFEDDEAGRLPRELKRGVLSEDGVYDLIARVQALREDLLSPNYAVLP